MLHLFVTQHLWITYNSGIFNWLYTAINPHVTLQVDYLLLLNFSDLFVFQHICSHVYKTSLHLSNLVLQLHILFLKLLEASESLLDLLLHFLVVFLSNSLFNSHSLFIRKRVLHT